MVVNPLRNALRQAQAWIHHPLLSAQICAAVLADALILPLCGGLGMLRGPDLSPHILLLGLGAVAAAGGLAFLLTAPVVCALEDRRRAHLGVDGLLQSNGWNRLSVRQIPRPAAVRRAVFAVPGVPSDTRVLAVNGPTPIHAACLDGGGPMLILLGSAHLRALARCADPETALAATLAHEAAHAAHGDAIVPLLFGVGKVVQPMACLAAAVACTQCGLADLWDVARVVLALGVGIGLRLCAALWLLPRATQALERRADAAAARAIGGMRFALGMACAYPDDFRPQRALRTHPAMSRRIADAVRLARRQAGTDPTRTAALASQARNLRLFREACALAQDSESGGELIEAALGTA